MTSDDIVFSETRSPHFLLLHLQLSRESKTGRKAARGCSR